VSRRGGVDRRRPPVRQRGRIGGAVLVEHGIVVGRRRQGAVVGVREAAPAVAAGVGGVQVGLKRKGAG